MCTALMAAAQQNNMTRSQRIYQWFVEGKGDSIHAALGKELQGQLPAAVFNDMFRQTELMYGKLQTKGEWATENANGMTLYYCDMQYERQPLRFILAFNDDGSMNTIRLAPAPAKPDNNAAGSGGKPETAADRPFTERDITVGAKGYALPGTLTLPKKAGGQKDGRWPCVILVHGSGPNDRDETVGQNKPFRDLAHGLAARGIAVIRYDKRTKVYADKSVPAGKGIDYDSEAVDDAVAAMEYAGRLPEICPDSIYVLGHSLGGTLAPRIAQKGKTAAGIIIVAGLARPLEDAIEEQTLYVTSLTNPEAAGLPQMTELKRQIQNVRNIGTAAFDKTLPLPLNLPQSYWEFAKGYNPCKAAASLRIPIMVLQGERDYQVTMADFELWRAALHENKKAVLRAYPELNHLLQPGSGKSTPYEYYRMSKVPAYISDDIVSFIKKGI